MSAPDKCTPQEEIFAAKYLECGNATTAATFAKYSAKTAYAKGSELLKRPRVAKRIEALKSTVTKRVIVSAERVLREMCTVAFSDIRHYAIDDDGNVQLAAGAPDSAMRAIKKLKRKVRWIPNGDELSIKEVETEIELWNKDAELTALGRTHYLKLFTEAARDDGFKALGEAMLLAEQRIAAERETKVA